MTTSNRRREFLWGGAALLAVLSGCKTSGGDGSGGGLLDLGGGGPESVNPLPDVSIRAFKTRFAGGARGFSAQLSRFPLTTPAIVGDSIYIGGGFQSTEFYALTRDGHQKWAVQLSDNGPTPAVANADVVAFNTESCTLFVVAPDTGKMLWAKWLGDPMLSQPALHDDTLLTAYPFGGAHQLTAFRARSGRRLWDAQLAADVMTAPIIHGDSAYVTTFDGTLGRYELASGKKLWSRELGATSAPFIDGNTVWVSQRTEDGGLAEGFARLNASDGGNAGALVAVRPAPWLDLEVQRDSTYASSQADNDAAVGFSVAPASANIGAAEQNVGQSRVQGLWEYQGSRPVIVKGIAYATQGDRIVAVDLRTGQNVWSEALPGDLKKLGGHLATPPAIAGGKLYIGTTTGELQIRSQKTGALERTIGLGTPIRFQPVVSQGTLYVGTADGKLAYFELDDPSADGWHMWGGSAGHNTSA